MVLLVVKGTKFPDEFTVERSLADTLGGPAEGPATAAAGSDAAVPPLGIAPAICHIQNARHQLRLMLLSAQELAREAQARPAPATGAPSASLAADGNVTAYTAFVEELFTQLKDRTTPVTDTAYDTAAAKVRELTIALFPAYCTHPSGGTEAAIQALYEQHDNPDLDEDTRLVVYHCRAILDPLWKINELDKEGEAGLWFCGKLMEGTLAKYCGRNERSKVTVKVAPRAGPAPSGEPRMSYDDQRALFQRIREKREVFKTLEESELRDRVVRQARGRVALAPGSMPSTLAGDQTINTSQLRSIYPRKEERTVPLS